MPAETVRAEVLVKIPPGFEWLRRSVLPLHGPGRDTVPLRDRRAGVPVERGVAGERSRRREQGGAVGDESGVVVRAGHHRGVLAGRRRACLCGPRRDRRRGLGCRVRPRRRLGRRAGGRDGLLGRGLGRPAPRRQEDRLHGADDHQQRCGHKRDGAHAHGSPRSVHGAPTRGQSTRYSAPLLPGGRSRSGGCAISRAAQHFRGLSGSWGDAKRKNGVGGPGESAQRAATSMPAPGEKAACRSAAWALP